MKSMVVGIVASVLIATAVGAYEADEHRTGSPMGSMMQGMQGMMGENKPGEQSHEMMQDMKQMMSRMSKMMDMCSQMMSHKSDGKKEESSN